MGLVDANVNTQNTINCMWNEINLPNIQTSRPPQRSIRPPARAALQHATSPRG
jgi:hypothetical protein